MAVGAPTSPDALFSAEPASPPEAVAPPPGNPRFPLFDGLRAVAALSVLVFHAGFQSSASLGNGIPSRLLAQLNVGVTVFFVISGFLLYRPLLAARSGAGPPIRLRDYARRRVLRIVPAYWVALTVLAIYPGLHDMFTGHFWVYYGFAQDYSGVRVLGGIDTAWTLGCEVVFYAVLPFLSIAFDRAARAAGRRVWWQFELAALGTLCVLSAVYRAVSYKHLNVLPYNSIAATFVWFALGMALALVSVQWASGQAARLRAAERVARLGWPLAAVFYIVLCFGLRYDTVNPFLEHDSTLHVLAWYALAGLVAVSLVMPAVFSVGAPTAVRRFLSWGLIAWLGLISYGIYLYHNRLLVSLDRLGVAHHDRWLRFVWLSVASLAVSVVCAAISYYVIERPILRLKERPRVLRIKALRGEV